LGPDSCWAWARSWLDSAGSDPATPRQSAAFTSGTRGRHRSRRCLRRRDWKCLKWFPDYRGLCVGLTAAAFGIGTATTIAPIADMLKASGYQHTFIVWGIIQGLWCWLHRSSWPGRPWMDAAELESERSQNQGQNPHFGCRYDALADAMPAIVLHHLRDDDMLAFGGLVVTAQLNPWLPRTTSIRSLWFGA